MKLKYFFIATICAVGSFKPQSSPAQGIIQLSNIDQAAPGDTDPVGVASRPFQQFVTGINANGYSLNAIQVLFAPAFGTPSGFTLNLWGDSVGAPDGPIATLNGNPNPTAAGLYSYTVGSPVILAANTAYWIQGTANANNSGNDFEWALAQTTDATSTDGWTVGKNEGGDFPVFAIDATPAPEPSACALLAVGGLGALCFRRRNPKL